MAKIEFVQNGEKAGGKKETRNFSLDITAEEIAVLVKTTPIFENGVIELANKLAEEKTRHNKVMEVLERDRFEHQKEEDEKDLYWKGQYDELREELTKTRDELRKAESELWDWRHGLKTKDDRDNAISMEDLETECRETDRD